MKSKSAIEMKDFEGEFGARNTANKSFSRCWIKNKICQSENIIGRVKA